MKLRSQRALMALVAAAAFAPIAVHAQSALNGRVVSDSGKSIAGATVTLAGIGYSVKTDSLGRFHLAGTPGSTLELSVQAPGFRDGTVSVVLSRGRPVVRDFVLISEETPLPEVNPSDRLFRGRVTDTEGVPLAYANVQVNGGRRYMSDDSGRFTVPLPDGHFTLLVRRIGFEPEQVGFDGPPSAAFRIQLRAVAQALPEQRITGRAAFVSLDLGGFYRRMKDAERGINHGYFMTPEDFEFRKPTLITNMAEGVPAMKIYRPSSNPRSWVLVGLSNCRMTVYLDRVRVAGRLGGTDDLINELIDPSTIAAMEMYPRAVGAPPEYQAHNGTCGVILLWSK